MKNGINEFYDISENYKLITEKLDKAMLKANRTDEIKIMAVTKNVPVNRVNYAVSLGIKLLGENRAQEFIGKYPGYEKNCEIHFIGGLQNNKVKYIIDKVAMIESVNGAKLAAEINKRALSLNLIMDILIELNIGSEENKTGATADELFEIISEISELSAVRIRGLMTIPPIGDNRKYFEKTEKLFHDSVKYVKTRDRACFNTLSMGMSYDYETAVEYGSNIIRLGRALFGERFNERV